MAKKTRIAWEGKGPYVRQRDYQGSVANGISWVGFVWRRTISILDRGAHQVRSQNEIWRKFEPRYH